MLERVRQGKTKLLYLFPLIIIFWNNVHGGVVSGLGLLGMYALGEFLNKKPFKNYLITLAVCCAVLLINPWGFDYIKFLIMANTLHRTYIIEWWGLFSHYHLFKHLEFKFFMLITILIEIFTISKPIKEWYKNADKVKYIVLLSTLYLAVSHVKMLPFFVIASLCFIYEDVNKLIEKIKLPTNKIIYIFAIVMTVFTILTKELSLPVGFGYFPVEEVEFIKQNNLKGKILCDFGDGSYVSYKLYPHNTIFMDGRYEEVYYDYMIPMLKNFYLAYPNYKETLAYFPPDIIIQKKSYPIFDVLKKSQDWNLVFESKFYGVFIPAGISHKEFIQPSNDLNYYKNTLFNTDIKF